MLIIDTNIIRETCEVTFDETAPCNASVFEVVGDEELGTSIFEDEEEEATDGEAEATTHAVDPAVSATGSDDDDGPDPTTSTSRGLIEEVTQASPATPEETPVWLRRRRLRHGKHRDTFSVVIHLNRC